MNELLNRYIKSIQKARRDAKRYVAVLVCLSIVVGLGTFSALTKEGEALTHQKRVLVCALAEGETPVAHAHNADCFDADGVLVCTLPEVEAHEHTADCYETVTETVCGLEENPGHVHTADCYALTDTLTCGLEESEGHLHTDDCYSWYTDYVCGQGDDPDHMHDDSCLGLVRGELICELEESEGHVHSEDCYARETEPGCGMEEGEGAHTHGESCYVTHEVLVCGREELPVHVHGPECFETVEMSDEEIAALAQKDGDEKEDGEQITGAEEEESFDVSQEDLILVAAGDPEADVESEAFWQAMFAELELSGKYDRDLLAVAATQLGYRESEANYALSERGTYKGYTRYGAWYGIPYGDWCAMFVSFCIRWAGIPDRDMPIDCNCDHWIRTLSERGMLGWAESYTPKPGDLVFYDFNDDDVADHVGIVTAVDPDNDIFETVEGNRTDMVERFTLRFSDAGVMCWGILPEEAMPVSFEEQAMPACHFEGGTDEVSVVVDAPEGAFPKDVTMRVSPVAAEEVMDAVTGSVKAQISAVHAVDICFLDANGVEIEPLKPVRVAMTPKEKVNAKEPQIVHVDDKGGAVVVEQSESAAGEVAFSADAFSVYAIVYTVDFHYELDGKSYDYSIPGGGFVSFRTLAQALAIVEDDPETELNELDQFVSDVERITFSRPEFMNVSKLEQDSTVGEIKTRLGLNCEYSPKLTAEDIAAINAQSVKAGDWALIALEPFDSIETLTVTMHDGDIFTIKVTDAQEITDSSASTINVNKSYLICYEADGKYYLLKNDGSVDDTHAPESFEGLNSTYCWTFNFVFEEKDREGTLTYNYYLIRPIDNHGMTIALNSEGQDLLQQSNNNVAVVPVQGGGFRLLGYNDVRLNFENGEFSAKQSTTDAPFDGVTVHIYEMDSLPTYEYMVRASDEDRGTVTVDGGTQQTISEQGHEYHYYEAVSDTDKKNAGAITATPQYHPDGAGHNKWTFDHWEMNGTPLDRDQYPDTIPAKSLPIPFNGSRLVAHFRQNPQYIVPDSEKTPSSFEDMTEWMNDLQNRNIPLDEAATDKTAEVFDYENRIYRVDLTSKANFETFDGNVDMAFCLDVSNSMKFPSKLVPVTELPIYQINDSGGWGPWAYDNRTWLDQSRGWNNPYYLIADPTRTATVFKVYYQDGNWKAQDASRETESDKSFIIGQDFRTTWTADQYDNDNNKNHPFNAGDNNDSEYVIYNAGDNGRDRFYYLNQSLLSATTDLKSIKDLLAVAGAQSPNVRVAYNTFFKDLGSARQDFQNAAPITVNFAYSAGGGTRPDQAFNDAQSFHWSGDDRYVVLITDGAPQGVRTGEAKETTNAQIEAWVRTAAQNLKNNSNVKFITIGLSMENVESGKRLLYDLADNDKNGNKMFYLAESASDLPNILRQIIKTIMDEAIVFADVTDTVNDAFYPVDKLTGMPLAAGDMIDIEGRKVDDPDDAAGILSDDGVTIVWTDQAIDQKLGWHGTLYVKAKEDLIGGNAVKTNGEATIKATKYRVGEDNFSFDESQLHDKLKSLEVNFASPRVNVNELGFNLSDTAWSVYLGTSVNPKEQLRKLYDEILVSEVVNTDGALHYPLTPDSITDDREPEAEGTPQTFALAPVILACIQEDDALSEKYLLAGQTLDWDAFYADLENDGITVPYHPYGIEGGDSRIVVTLTKDLTGDESELATSPHKTTVTDAGETPAEQYVLTAKFYPDYDHVLPPGQGGTSEESFHTGTFGTMYQGHSAGNETSTNTHVIHVFAKGLAITKTDPTFENVLTGAIFVLYRPAREGDDTAKRTTLTGLTGEFFPAAELDCSEDGKATVDALEQLAEGENYYLVETKAPAGYNRLANPISVTLTVQDSYTILPSMETMESEPADAVYNWTQTADIRLGESSSIKRTDADNSVDLTHSAIIPNAENGLVYYRIANTSGYELPRTGGIGTGLYTVFGGALLLGAALCLAARGRSGGKRRKSETPA